jgi:hypothetical protein
MPKRPRHAAQRAISDLTLGVAKSRQRKLQRDAEMGLRERLLQYQSVISGQATPGIAYAEVSVDFDYDFYYAPGNRDSDLARPQFWFGLEVNKQVLASAQVRSWVDDDNTGATIGAVVELAIMATVLTKYSGVLHMTFQGYGALNDGDSPDIN